MGTHVLQGIAPLRPDGGRSSSTASSGAPGRQPEWSRTSRLLCGPLGGKHDECAWLLADVLCEVRVLDHPETRCTPAACADRPVELLESLCLGAQGLRG